MTTADPQCLCAGGGTYTVSIPVADAVVSIERTCPAHGRSPAPVRRLALDTATQRIGEVMQEPAEHGYWSRYALRSVGGGREWDVQPRHVQLLDDIPMEP